MPAAAAGAPEGEFPIGADFAGPADNTPAAVEESLGDLAAAVNQVAAGPAAAPARPARVAAQPAAARPRAAKAAPVDNDETQKKKRDPLPLVIAGIAGTILVIVVAVMIGVKMSGSDSKPTTTAEKTQIPPAPDYNTSYGDGGSGFFGNIPAGRTSADYKREQEEKKSNPPK